MVVFRLLLFLVAFAGAAVAQQPYVRNRQLACENPANDNNITRGFICNGLRRSCQSYLTFRSQPPSYSSAAAIASLLGSQPAAILSINGLSSANAVIPANTPVIVPVNCSCSTLYYQHNASYTITDRNENYFRISNDTYQGLTTCQAMEAQNSIYFRNLLVGNRLLVPLRCACPTSDQLAAGSNYLLTYIITWGDALESIARTFGSDVQRIQQANQLSPSDIIFPFTPLLVPLSSEPTRAQLPPPSPPPPPSPQLIPTGGGGGGSDNKGVFIGVGVAAAVLLILVVAGSFLFCYRRKRRAAEPPVSVSPKTETDFADKSKSMSWSAAPLQFAVESLTIYKFRDLQAAAGNFSESNRIKGSVYRATFNGDDAAVKVLKGDVSDEINLLKKINHTNIVRLSGFCLHQSNSYLVYEYAENGSVSDWLHHPTGKKDQTFHVILSWKQRVQIAYDAAEALNYLHHYITPPYVHKNLKSSNVVLDSDFRAKIANFGLARTMQEEGDDGEAMQMTRHIIGTQGYMAPEYIENGVITPKLDVFAFGVVMLELLSGREAAASLGKNDGEEMLYVRIGRVIEGENLREKLQGFIDPALGNEYPLELAFSVAQLASNCVAHDLNARPSMSEVQMTLSKILSSSLDWDPSIEMDRSISLDSAR